MAEIRHRPNTKIGQNFLVDLEILDFILKQADIKKEDSILEVGAGRGILTKGILERSPKTLFALEIDQTLHPFLSTLEEEYPNLRLIWGDALRDGFPKEFNPVPNKMIANIPYHITTPLLWKVLETLSIKGLGFILLMVQKEAAERICAPPRCKDRYPLGVTVQSMGESHILRLVPPEAFRPSPSVTSALLEIRIEKNLDLPLSSSWRSLLRSGFSQRRKTLVNNLNRDFPWIRDAIGPVMESLGLNPLIRAEELETGTWRDLHSCFSDLVEKRKQATA